MLDRLGLDRLPLASRGPVVNFAVMRLSVAVAVLAALPIVGFPHPGRLALVVGALGLPWAIAVLASAARAPRFALSPLVAIGDMVVLVAGLAAVPELDGSVAVLMIFAFGAHASIQGERRGLVIAAAGATAYIVVTTISEQPLPEEIVPLSDILFALTSLATAFVVGRLRTAESRGRLRAEELTRRSLELEDGVRRRVAESIHDGPVQELVSLELTLAAADQAIESGDADRAHRVLADARGLAERNVEALRDEIVSLGRRPSEEASFESAVERCLPVWRRRYGLEVDLEIAALELPPLYAGALFDIAQEAVVNAGRHAQGERVELSLSQSDGAVVLAVSDDGLGFQGGVDAAIERALAAGHMGVASMRERASLLGGELAIDSGERGSRVVARAPLDRGE